MGLVRPVGPFPRLSRRFTDGSSTDGLIQTLASTYYVDQDALSISFWMYRFAAAAASRQFVNCNPATGNGWFIELRNAAGGNALRFNSSWTTAPQRRHATNAPTL